MKRVSAPGYDLFKLIITLLLVAILLILSVRGCGKPPRRNHPKPEPISATATQTTISATDTPTAEMPSPTPTLDVTLRAPTVTQTPTQTPTETATPPTPTATPEPVNTGCATSLPSRLAPGQTALVVRNLNLRNGPSISAPIIITNIAGTLVEIIDGPVCQPQAKGGSYLWWKIRLANGVEGWSAETPLLERLYFLEPQP